MSKKTISIDTQKCNGCGLCISACHEGALGLVDGKAVLLRDDYCDGLGDCLPVCPTAAITIGEPAAKIHKPWPVQIKLVPVNAPYFNNAHLLVSADCAAYAYDHFHQDFMENKITLIGCPKLDTGDYSEKLTAILSENNIHAVTVARMEVPCCGGIENAVKTALRNSGKPIPLTVVTLSTDGRIRND